MGVIARVTRDDGQASVEHTGLVLLLALLLGALVTVEPPTAPADAILRAIGAPGPPEPSRLEVVDRYVWADLDDFLAYRASPDRDPRLDWSSDECSAPVVGSTGASFAFTDACLRHDFGYRNYRRLGLFEERKPIVDDRFLADMRDHCETRALAERDRCRAWAQVFYEAVRRFGHLVGRPR
jgi:Prokaryotic phospholipase A2